MQALLDFYRMRNIKVCHYGHRTLWQVTFEISDRILPVITEEMI